jgi:Ion channel
MVTVGYGDITPSSDLEVLFGILTMFVCCGVFAYVINEIGVIVKNYYQEQKEINDRV